MALDDFSDDGLEEYDGYFQRQLSEEDEDDEDEDDEGSGGFVDPGEEDEEVPESEAVWELPDDPLPLDPPDDYEDGHLSGADE